MQTDYIVKLLNNMKLARMLVEVEPFHSSLVPTDKVGNARLKC